MEFEDVFMGMKLLLKQAFEEAAKVVDHDLFKGLIWRNKNYRGRWCTFELLG